MARKKNKLQPAADEDPDGYKLIARNKKAGHDFVLEARFEAGIVLQGTEVKSLRDGRANLSDSFARLIRGEMFVHEMEIPQYSHGTYNNHEPKRPRKLLLHRREINKLTPQLKEKGLTMIPTRLYFKRGLAKIEIALARGKSKGDKREDLRKKDHEKEMKRYS
ncbi:MAG: SsrA-binding protein SmpB [Planctomycetota bacterium]|nr:SsrA-binding protein SmpB [Planctomycetota bacterium]